MRAKKSKDLIRSITKSSDDYDEKYMKIKFNSGDELPLNKTIEIPNMSNSCERFFMKITLSTSFLRWMSA